MASKKFGLGPELQLMTPGSISSGLVQNPSSSTLPSPSVVSCVLPTVTLILVDTTSTPSSTSINQDAPSASTSPTTHETKSLVIHPEPSSEESSSRDVIPSNLHPVNQPFQHLSKWTKNHPLDNVKLDEFGGVLKNKARIFIANAAYKNMTVYQMDVKTVFLNGVLREEFSKGVVDPTLFTKKEGKDILLVQIYIDNINFAYTNPDLYDTFANIMSSKFKMSMMGKMSVFLDLQISQSPRGIFINQSKYALEIIKKYDMESSDPVDTPMAERTKLDEDIQGILVALLVIVICSALLLNWVFRYLKGTINMGLWYSKDTRIALTAYAEADHDGC
ncbi:retrovirus-related pol polyprotein from transposon TNT 1-94 [Tanacetum coccineum]